MVSALPTEHGTLEHELQECLIRLVDAGKITVDEKQAVDDEYETLDDEQEFSPKFKARLQELFNLDADILEARVGTLKDRNAVIGGEIATEEAGLEETVAEEWEIVEGVARKQAETLTWAKKVFDPLGDRLRDLQREEDLNAHASLLRQTTQGSDTDFGMAA
ncbi:MAG: hypothetical protein HOO67_06835 [Candidatus Peribacteraceae bacterium]|nr:hypothetical protein [Candidatus Peribacteraceae bacterium]